MAKPKFGFKLKTRLASGALLESEGPAGDDVMNAMNMLAIFGGSKPREDWDENTRKVHAAMNAFIEVCKPEEKKK